LQPVKHPFHLYLCRNPPGFRFFFYIPWGIISPVNLKNYLTFWSVELTTRGISSYLIDRTSNMQKSYNIYNNLGYWFLTYIVLVFGGFYHSYFSDILKPRPGLIHLHFILMAIWVIMLIVQPFLVKYKKLVLHRAIGKFSYVFVPALLITTYLVIRREYFNSIKRITGQSAKAVVPFSQDQIMQKAALFSSIATYYFILFIIFYALAVYNRKKSPMHARYMMATSLTLLGPTVDRILFNVFHLEFLPGKIPIESLSFFIADAVLGYLLWKDYSKKKPTRALVTAFLITFLAQVLYFSLQDSYVFSKFMAFFMRPA